MSCCEGEKSRRTKDNAEASGDFLVCHGHGGVPWMPFPTACGAGWSIHPVVTPGTGLAGKLLCVYVHDKHRFTQAGTTLQFRPDCSVMDHLTLFITHGHA